MVLCNSDMSTFFIIVIILFALDQEKNFKKCCIIFLNFLGMIKLLHF